MKNGESLMSDRPILMKRFDNDKKGVYKNEGKIVYPKILKV